MSGIHLESLPRWAIVAFAGRCVCRIESLFPDLQKKALDFVCEAAAKGTITVHRWFDSSGSSAVDRAMDAAYFAASHAATFVVAGSALEAVEEVRSVDQKLEEAMTGDFTELYGRAKLERWPDDKPVWQDVFGPL